LYNLNGGYVVLGIEIDKNSGGPVLPPRGIADSDLDRIQLEIVGACKGSISPQYLPQIFVETFQERTVIVLWVPAGDNRPYEAPTRDGKRRGFWVRCGSATVEASGDLKRQLLEQASKIPFDDRRSLTASVDVLMFTLVRKFLSDVGSHLASLNAEPIEIYRKMRLVVPMNDHFLPRNVALLFFTNEPERFFRGAHIDVVQFGDGAGGDLIEEKEFHGPVHEQIRTCLAYLNGLGGALLKKVPHQAEIERTVPYPYEAMEEAIVNAVYHRSYESPPEPVKIYLYPDRMEITSCPGPVPGLRKEHFEEGNFPPVPARNRRIGEFLKDLRLAEGRGTGIPKIQRKMAENGSPKPLFDFDEGLSYFRVILPVHPRYQVLHSLREAAHLWAIGEKGNAVAHLERAFERVPASGALAAQLIEYAFAQEDERLAFSIMEIFEEQEARNETSMPYLTMARLLVDRNQTDEALVILERIPPQRTIDETMQAAILKKRMGDYQGAHRLFSEAYSINPDTPKLIHEFAQTKFHLARKLSTKTKAGLAAKKRLNAEVAELLRRAIQLADNPTREAWCWFDLARTLDWLRYPMSEVESAFLKARSLLPDEERFQKGYDKWRNHSRPRNKGKDGR